MVRLIVQEVDKHLPALHRVKAHAMLVSISVNISCNEWKNTSGTRRYHLYNRKVVDIFSPDLPLPVQIINKYCKQQGGQFSPLGNTTPRYDMTRGSTTYLNKLRSV